MSLWISNYRRQILSLRMKRLTCHSLCLKIPIHSQVEGLNINSMALAPIRQPRIRIARSRTIVALSLNFWATAPLISKQRLSRNRGSIKIRMSILNYRQVLKYSKLLQWSQIASIFQRMRKRISCAHSEPKKDPVNSWFLQIQLSITMMRLIY